MVKRSSTKPCDCGMKRYGFKRGKARVYLCYTCGMFEGENFPDDVLYALVGEPILLLHLKETEYLKPIP